MSGLKLVPWRTLPVGWVDPKRRLDAARIRVAVEKRRKDGDGCTGCEWWSMEEYMGTHDGIVALCECKRSRNYEELRLCGCGCYSQLPKTLKQKRKASRLKRSFRT